MMMRKLLYILMIAAIPFTGNAQSFYTSTEYGVSLGGSQYFGDLNDRYGFNTPHPAVGVFTRIHMNPYIAVRIGAAGTQLSYNDKLSSNEFNKARNLNFQTTVLEGGLSLEFNFFRFITGEEKSRWTPYLVGGAGVFYYDPYTFLNGRRYYLRTLGTEGQYSGYGDRTYSQISFMFPVGAGFKYWLRPGLNFSFEIANRLTLTDYLDDVSTNYVGAEAFQGQPGFESPALALQDRSVEISNTALGRAGKQRGNSGSKDQYLMYTFSLSIQLKTYKCPSYMTQGFQY